MPNVISEDQIEKAAVALLKDRYGYSTLNAYTADAHDLGDRSGRASKQQVVFGATLKNMAMKLNPGIPDDVVDSALEALVARRSAMAHLAANQEVYGLIRNGIPVEYDDNGKRAHALVKVINFAQPTVNDFCAVTQLWIHGDRSPRRPDILVYVNGLPLVFLELKNSNVKVQNAYDDNLTNYKRDIPQLFLFNAFCVLSNALETKVGSFEAGYEHFFSWLRPDDETEKVDRLAITAKGTSLERVIHGLFPKERLLDYVDNFILYHKGTVKIVAQNHQFLGVNKAVESFKGREQRGGKLGVFWHTQGSGKSFSMIFLARKIFHGFAGNYTFVIVTDREDLDGQIYRNFLDTDTVQKNEAARPKDSTQMRDFLGRNLRLVFTLIQKFRYDKGREYPVLSPRNDIIVIVDEAHRTQYASLAENMRKGLPNAQFFAFTGTPILGKGKGKQLYEGKTFDWFGGYVSQYNFVQSVDDGATVPLYYQKRVPEVLIQNANLGKEFYDILEEADLDDKAQDRLEKTFSTELEVIKRDDRLETIAKDIVAHFPARGYLGKAMVISIDKFTSVRMYDKVQRHWKEAIKTLVGRVGKAPTEAEKKRLERRLEWMRSVEMAVVISEDAAEEERFSKQGLDIKSHRKRLNTLDANGHDLEYRFKEPRDPLQIVFVCAMWLTGFDAPTVSTLYLDKPMQGHTLMQTIARANRVTSHAIYGVSKGNGEVVDYYNVFRNMKKALSEYAQGEQQGSDEDDSVVPEKSQLFTLLDDAIDQGSVFCDSAGIDLKAVLAYQTTFQKVDLFAIFADRLLSKDTWWKEFKVYENTITSLYEACKPEILEGQFRPLVPVFQYLRGVTEGLTDQGDIESVKQKIGELLDQSVVTANKDLFLAEAKPEFQIVRRGKLLDLSKIDFEKLRQEFQQKEYQHIEIASLREFIEHKLELLLKENRTRVDFAQRLQEIINNYNAGGMTTESYYDDLVRFAEEMQVEGERHTREGLSADELEVFDLLKKDKMTKEEEVRVKNAAKHLLHRLLDEQPKVLVQDWFRDRQSQAKVRGAIEKVLDADLPDSYDRNLFAEKTGALYELVFEYASQGIKWAS